MSQALLMDNVAAVVRLSFHTAKYGTQWTREDHALLLAVLSQVGQVAGEAWARASGFRAYVTVSTVPGTPAEVEVLGVAYTLVEAQAFCPERTEWGAEGCASPLCAVGQHGVRRLSCWELLFGGPSEEEMRQWTFAD